MAYLKVNLLSGEDLVNISENVKVELEKRKDKNYYERLCTWKDKDSDARNFTFCECRDDKSNKLMCLVLIVRKNGFYEKFILDTYLLSNKENIDDGTRDILAKKAITESGYVLANA